VLCICNVQADNPLRRILNYAADAFLSHLPIVYILTVVGRREVTEGEGGLVLRYIPVNFYIHIHRYTRIYAHTYQIVVMHARMSDSSYKTLLSE
jgi:hypothetical protein